MEDLIRNNKDKLMSDLPDGHQARFAMKLQSEMNRKNKIKRFRLALASAAAVLLLVLLLNKQDFIIPQIYEENNKVVEMRQHYEEQVDEAIMILENVLQNVDDSTRNEINKVIENLTSTNEVFAEIAPLPEEKQLAITSQLFGNQLEILNSIYDRIDKKEENNHEDNNK